MLYNKCPRANVFIHHPRPLYSFLRHIQLLLNYSYFSRVNAPSAGADVAVVSSGMRLSSRFLIVFCHRLAIHKYLVTIDQLTKTRFLLSSRADSVTVMDMSEWKK